MKLYVKIIVCVCVCVYSFLTLQDKVCICVVSAGLLISFVMQSFQCMFKCLTCEKTTNDTLKT